MSSSKGSVRIGGSIKTGGQTPATPSGPGKWAPVYNNFQVDFDRDEFTRLIYGKGYDVTWEKAAFCPNRKGLAPKDHNIACDVCDGTGFIYYDPIVTRMLITGVKLTQSYYAYGRWDGGSVMVTALPELTINYWDRLTLGNGKNRYQELLLRQRSGDVDRPKYNPLCLSYASWIGRDGKNVVADLDSDVSIAKDGTLVWAGTNRPDAGDYYTVAYEYRPRYVVLDLLHQHRESTVGNKHYPFPVQAVAKLDFLIRDEGKDEPQAEVEDPFVAK